MLNQSQMKNTQSKMQLVEGSEIEGGSEIFFNDWAAA
jgi:hypothetical protein